MPEQVLVLDDMGDGIDFQTSFSRMIKGAGFEVISASSTSDFVAKAQDSRVSLVLVDLSFKDMNHRIEALRWIKAAEPRRPIIAVTSFPQDPRSREQLSLAHLDSIGFIEKIDSADKPFLKIISQTIAAYRNREPTDHAAAPEDTAGEVRDGVELSSDLYPRVYQLDHIGLALYSKLQAHPELLRLLDWRLFEELIADIVKTFGYTIELTRATKDGGIGVIALGRPEPWGEHRYLIQAKQSRNRIGVEPIRELMFLHNDLRATRSCLATTSTFTKGAWELSARYQWQLELRDYDGLKEWVEKAAKIKQKGSEYT